MMWDQRDCDGYLKTAAVLAAYVDQSISTNTFYNPAHFEGGKVPGTLVAKNLMLAYKWGLKTIYYSLINKVGAKHMLSASTEKLLTEPVLLEDEENCEACVL
jgi:ribonucleotide reductase alpha subunit